MLDERYGEGVSSLSPLFEGACSRPLRPNVRCLHHWITGRFFMPTRSWFLSAELPHILKAQIDRGLSPQKIRCVNDRVPSRSGERHFSSTTRR